MADDRPQTDDEALSMLLDHELPDHEAGRLRARLEREPALSERLDQLARTDARLRDAYSRVLDEPLPRSVLDLLEPSNVVPLKPRRHAPGWLSLPLAAAAAVALTVGVLVGTLVGPRGAEPRTDLVAGAGPVPPESALHGALETAPSGATRELGGGAAVTPMLTFQSASGRFCRQIGLESPRGTTEALACRRGERWQIELAAFTAASGGGVYRPAAGETPVRAAVDAVIDGAPLDAEAERALIAESWAR